MAKRMIKTKFTLDEVVEECTRRNSDQSEDDISDEESDVSSIDTVAEDLFLDGGDVTLDKQSNETDEDWEPSSKKPYTNRQDDSTSSEDKPQTSPTQRDSASKRPRGKGRARGRGKGRARGRGKGRARGRGRTASTSGQAEMSIPTSEERWNDVDVPDVTPPQPTFRPTKSPGPQLIRTANYTALQLFQLFFTNSVLLTIIKNTNDFGSTHQSNPSNPWIDVTVQDMLAFMAMVIYMGLIKLPSITDYWRESHLYSLPFPKTLLTGKKFLRICHSLHLSSLVDDAANEQRRGTSEFDRLCEIKPLYSEIRDACKINYHPGQEISIDERMVASKARIGIKQFMKNKPCRWGYKLFVLADSSNGYTWDFFVYEGKLQGNSGKGLSYESVMELVDTQLLGTGYKLFVDNFYTSPSLFCDLLQKRIWACGTIRTNRIGFPKTKINTLVSKSLRGSIRWIRKDSLLFVQWRDTRDVFMCTTLHTAHGGDTVQRRVKDADGHWVLKNISVPPAVKEYNRFMGGVDLSDSLINYYKVIHKTQRWYKTLFYHFMDIAIVNAFLLYKDLTKGKGEVPMHQKAFRETLVEELAAAAKIPAPSSTPRSKHHKPVHITAHSTMGRLRCRQCQAKTPVKCSSCDIPLCFVPNRDCYNEWHDANNL